MKKQILYKIVSIVGLVLLLSTVSILIGIDYKLFKNQKATFIDPEGNILRGTYYPGTKAAGLILVHGFGEDRVSLKSYSSEFVDLGFHVFAFDFSGHGRSSDVLPNDNEFILARQVLSAKEKFKSLSNLSDNEIFIVGHSMGGRAIVRSAIIDSNSVAGLILLGAAIAEPGSETQTNVTLFQELGTNNPSCDLLIITGTWEDVLPPQSARSLYQQLANESATGLRARTITPEGHIRELIIIKRLLHNYEVCSPKAIAHTKNWTINSLGWTVEQPYSAKKTTVRICFWIVGLIALGSIITFGTIWFNKQNNQQEIIPDKSSSGNATESQNDDRIEHQNNIPTNDLLNNSSTVVSNIQLSDPRKFLLMNLLAWLGAFPLFFILALLFLVIPLGIPYFSLVYVGPVASVGIVLLLLLQINRFMGVKSNWKIIEEIHYLQKHFQWKKILLCCGVFSGVIAFSVVFMNSGLYYIFPPNTKLFWLALFTLFSSIGFYALQLRDHIINSSPEKTWQMKALVNLIFFLPFVVIIAYFGISGSILFFIDGIHGLIILSIVILSGKLFQKIGNNRLITALFQAFLLNLLVIPRGPLLSYFS
ncbi:MAG: alpha/beta fold hydrolase [Candidatus Heimdallarchaeota archaeon]|nr:alpha/beta fold hydrolase [Candidatus Heimdallarchaeota archaeon]